MRVGNEEKWKPKEGEHNVGKCGVEKKKGEGRCNIGFEEKGGIA